MTTTFSLSNLEEGLMVRPSDLSQKVQLDPAFSWVHQGRFGTFHSLPYLTAQSFMSEDD